MISADLRVEGFDTPSWTQLISLFMPGLDERLADHVEGARGTLTLVEDTERTVLTAIDSTRGPVHSLCGCLTGDLEQMALTHSVRRVVVLRAGTMEELSERLGLSARVSDDYVSQMLGLLRAVRGAMDAGHIRLWPNPFANVPIPPPGAIARALDILLPRDRALLVMLFKPGTSPAQLATAAAVRRNHEGEIDLLAGPDLLRTWAGPTGGDWQRDYRVYVDAVSRNVAEVHMGIFSEVPTLEALLRRGGDPGAWAAETATRNMIISPVPAAVAVAVGADALRGVGRASAKALGGFDFAGRLLPLASQLRSRWLAARTVTDELGFDPLRVLATFLRRDDAVED